MLNSRLHRGALTSIGIFIAIFLLSVRMASAQMSPPTYDQIRMELFDQTNAWRTANSASILVRDQALDELIQKHVEDKAACGYSYGGGAHLSCNGDTLETRINAAALSPGGTGENMAAGFYSARDVEYTDLGLTNSDLPGSVPMCSTGRLALVNKPAGQAGPAQLPLCQRDADSVVIMPGFIDSWDRSPGHRTNMIGTFGFLGIGYDEGVISADDCASSARNAAGHLTDTTGCNNGPIAGQLFSAVQVREGLYAATGNSNSFRPGTAPADGSPPSGGTPPPASGGSPTPPSGVETNEETAARPSVHANMASMIEAVANLYELYGVYNTVRDEQPLNVQERARLMQILRGQSSGYSDLDIEQDIEKEIQDNPDGHLGVALQPYFQNLGDVMASALLSPLTSTPEERESARREFARVMQDSGSGQYDAAVSHAFLLNLSTVSIVTQHLSVKRVGDSYYSRSDSLPAPLVAATHQGEELISTMGLNALGNDYRYVEPSRHVWVRSYGRGGSEDEQNVLKGANSSDYGLLIGIDLPISAVAQAGIYVGTGLGDIDFTDASGQDETKYYSVGAYGSAQLGDGRFYGDVVAAATYIQHDHRRHLRFSSQTDTVTADYDSWIGSVQVGGGGIFHLRDLAVQPRVAAGYHYQYVDGFTEGGNSPLRLKVDKRKNDAWHAETGVTLSRDIPVFADAVLTPRAGFYYSYQNSLDKRSFSARFAAAPGNGNVFVLQGRDEDRHYYKQNIGFELTKNQLLRLSGYYQLLLDNKTEDHLFHLGMRYAF